MARKLVPEVILLDVELHDVNGFELVTWLGSDAKLRNVPIIAFSTFASDVRDLRNDAGRGTVTLLSKPFQRNELDKLVKKVI
jgi:CheY-like chemotaxis protein